MTQNGFRHPVGQCKTGLSSSEFDGGHESADNNNYYLMTLQLVQLFRLAAGSWSRSSGPGHGHRARTSGPSTRAAAAGTQADSDRVVESHDSNSVAGLSQAALACRKLPQRRPPNNLMPGLGPGLDSDGYAHRRHFQYLTVSKKIVCECLGGLCGWCCFWAVVQTMLVRKATPQTQTVCFRRSQGFLLREGVFTKNCNRAL